MSLLQTTPRRRTVCPYPGLRPYEREEADLFFGRDEQVAQVLERLHEARFLAVVGTSGCGKSSLVYAGIIPALETYLEVVGGSKLAVVALRPGDQPLRALSRALLEALDKERAGSEAAVSFLQADLRRGPLALVEALHATPPPEGSHLLFLIDQFEEIFRFRENQDRDEADAFVALLLATAKRTDVAAHVILTMRSDYIGDCAVFTGLPEAISASQFLTPRMTRVQRQKAIEGPALAAGGRVEPDLVNRLLNDMDSGPDQLPLMQHVMMRLWLKAQAGDGDGAAGIELKLKDYESSDIGGLAHALDLHADEAYGTLDSNQKPDPKRIAEVMFRLLSERDAGSGNEGSPRDTRRPTLLRTVAEVAGEGVTPADVAQVVEAFRAPGVNFLTPAAPEPLEPDTRLDVSHESLIRRWRRLQSWVEAEAKSAEIYRRLADRTQLWREGTANLLRRLETNAILAWRDRERPNAAWAARYGGDFRLAMRFLDESENDCRRAEIIQERKRNARVYQARWIAAISLAGFVVTLSLMGWAISEREKAKQARAAAEFTSQMLNDKNLQLKVSNLEALRKTELTAALTKAQTAFVRSFLLTDRAKDALDKSPQLAALLALEAVDAARAASTEADRISVGPGSEEALKASLKEALIETFGSSEEALRQALQGIGGRGLCGDSGPIHQIAATADGRRLVTAGSTEIWFWDVSDGGGVPRPSRLRGPKLPLNFLAIPTGNRWIIARDSADKVFLWRLREGRPAAEPEVLPIRTFVRYLTPSPEGHWLLTFVDSGPGKALAARLWDLTADSPSSHEVDLRTATEYVPNLAWSFDPKDRWLAIVKHDSTATCWDLMAPSADIRPVSLRPGGAGSKRNAVISQDGRRLVVCLQEAKARVWELEHPEREPRDIDLHEPGEVASILATDFHGRWAVTTAQALASHHPGRPVPPLPALRKLRLWDLSDPDAAKHPVVLGVPDSYLFRPTGVVVSDDQKWLACPTTPGFIVWKIGPNLATEAKPIAPLDRWTATTAGVGALTFSADGRRLMASGHDGVVRSWDLTLADPFQNSLALRGNDGPITALTISRDSRRLIAGSEDGTARLWDLDALSVSADPVEVRRPPGANLVFSPDRRGLAVAGQDGSVRLWDPTVEEPTDGLAVLLAPQPAPSPPTLQWALESGDRWLLAVGKEGSARIWDASAPGRGARVVDLSEFARIRSFLVGGSGHWMAASVFEKSAPQVGVVRLWDLASDGPGSRPISLNEEQDVVAFVGPGDRLLTVRVGRYSLWDLRSGLPPSGPTLLAGQEPSNSAFFHVLTPDGRRLLAMGFKGPVQMWDLEDPGAPPMVLARSEMFRTTRLGPLFFTPDSRRAIVRRTDGRILLWKLDGRDAVHDPVEPPDPESPEERGGDTGQGLKDVAARGVHPPIAPLSFSSSDGRWLIDAGRGGTVRLWDLVRPDPFASQAGHFASRESFPSLTVPRFPRSPFTNDGRWLTSTDGRSQNQLHLWDLRGTEPIDRATIPLESHEEIHALAVDPTGRWVALATSADSQLHVWELTSNGCVERTALQPARGSNPWAGLHLGPGGRRVTTVDVDSIPRVYRVPLDDLKPAAQRAVGRNLTRLEWNRFFPGQEYHKTFESLPEPAR
jgi:WD40 repeat protein